MACACRRCVCVSATLATVGLHATHSRQKARVTRTARVAPPPPPPPQSLQQCREVACPTEILLVTTDLPTPVIPSSPFVEQASQLAALVRFPCSFLLHVLQTLFLAAFAVLLLVGAVFLMQRHRKNTAVRMLSPLLSAPSRGFFFFHQNRIMQQSRERVSSLLERRPPFLYFVHW